jgi:hypothetical protein
MPIWVDEVEPDVSFQNLSHKSVDRTTARCDPVKDFRAFRFAFQGAFHSLDLTPDSTDAI